MPSNWLYVDTNFPTFTGEESANKKIETIQNYMYLLVEQMRYSLRNLDASNFNAVGLLEIGNVFTEPIYARIEDNEGRVTQLSVQADGLAAQIWDAEGDIYQIGLTVDGLTSLVSAADGRISALTQTVDGFQTTVSNLQGDVSSLTQTVNGFSLSVTNGETRSTIQLLANGTVISSKVIQFTGDVIFRSDLSDGKTVISGDNIQTGTIRGRTIHLNSSNALYIHSTYSVTENDVLGIIDYYPEDGKTKLRIESSAVLKILSAGDMSIDAYSMGVIKSTLYIGSTYSGEKVMIGRSADMTTRTQIELWGDVYVNGTKIG